MARTLNSLFEYTSARRLKAAQRAYDEFIVSAMRNKATGQITQANFSRFDALRKVLAREKRRHAHWTGVLRVERLP